MRGTPVLPPLAVAGACAAFNPRCRVFFSTVSVCAVRVFSILEPAAAGDNTHARLLVAALVM